jgi:hypothetical protein
MNFDEKMAKEMEEFKGKYHKEISDYEKIRDEENYRKIIINLQGLGKFKIKEYPNKIIDIELGKVTIYFSFYSFNYWDCNIEIAQYLKGKKYNLYASIDTEFINLEELETVSKCITEVKNIIDEVIGGTDGN